MFGFVTEKFHQAEITKVKEDFLQQKLDLATERRSSLKLSKHLEMEPFVNNFIIVVSNEAENLIVGYGKSLNYINENDLSPVLEFFDVVKKLTFFTQSKIFIYTEQKFDALNKLSPNERIAIFFGQTCHNEINKPTQEEILEPSVWKSMVLAGIEEYSASLPQKTKDEEQESEELTNFFVTNSQ